MGGHEAGAGKGEVAIHCMHLENSVSLLKRRGRMVAEDLRGVCARIAIAITQTCPDQVASAAHLVEPR